MYFTIILLIYHIIHLKQHISKLKNTMTDALTYNLLDSAYLLDIDWIYWIPHIYCRIDILHFRVRVINHRKYQ